MQTVAKKVNAYQTLTNLNEARLQKKQRNITKTDNKYSMRDLICGVYDASRCNMDKITVDMIKYIENLSWRENQDGNRREENVHNNNKYVAVWGWRLSCPQQLKHSLTKMLITHNNKCQCFITDGINRQQGQPNKAPYTPNF